MKGNLRKFIKWVKKHKTALIIAGISITAIILIAVYNKDSRNELWNYLCRRINEHPKGVKKATKGIEDTVRAINNTKEINSITHIKTESLGTVTEKTIELNTDVITKRHYEHHCGSFPVSGGPVKLPQGRHPSPEKIKLGKRMGLDFEALGITWRNDFIKGAA